MSIRDAILESLPDTRMIPLAELHEAVSDHDRNAVDCAIRGLVRAGVLRSELGHIGRPGATMTGGGATKPAPKVIEPRPAVARPISEPKEAAVDTINCKTCGQTKPVTEMMTFRGAPIRQCKACRAANRRGANGQATASPPKTLADVAERHAKPGRKPGVPPAAVAASVARPRPDALAKALEELRAQHAKLTAAIAALEAL